MTGKAVAEHIVASLPFSVAVCPPRPAKSLCERLFRFVVDICQGRCANAFITMPLANAHPWENNLPIKPEDPGESMDISQVRIRDFFVTFSVRRIRVCIEVLV